MTIQHKIVACRCRRKSVEKTCEKFGLANYRYRGDFFSRFLYFFKRHYLIFTRSADAAQSDMLPDAFYRRYAPVHRIAEKIRRSEKGRQSRKR